MCNCWNLNHFFTLLNVSKRLFSNKFFNLWLSKEDRSIFNSFVNDWLFYVPPVFVAGVLCWSLF